MNAVGSLAQNFQLFVVAILWLSRAVNPLSLNGQRKEKPLDVRLGHAMHRWRIF